MTHSRFRSCPKLQCLEDRWNPAGNVTVSVVAGDLVVTGDGNLAGNQITINETAAQTFLITGAGTTVNGAASVDTSTLSAVTRDIKFTFGAGNDNVGLTATGLGTYRDVIANLGTGSDAFSITGLYGRNMTVNQPNLSNDNDSTSITGCRASGIVSVSNQNGADVTSINSKVAGGVVVTNRDGGDTVDVQGKIGRYLRVLNTAGALGNLVTVGAVVGGYGLIQNPGMVDSSTTLNGAEFVGSLTISNGSGGPTSTSTILNGCTVLGPILITGGNGMDQVRLDALKTEYVTLNLVGGNNDVDVTGGTAIAGRLSITAGADNDRLFMNSGDNKVLAVLFSAGNGTNSANISGLAANVVTYNGGSGQDTLLADDANRQTRIVDDLVFYGREGTNTLSITGKSATERSLVGGRLMVSGGAGVDAVTLEEVDVYYTTGMSLGAGSDLVKLDDTRFFTNFALSTGAGDDVIDIDRDNAFAGMTEFLADLAIYVGTGSDTLRIAGNVAQTSVLVYGFVGGDLLSAEVLDIGTNAERMGYPTF